MAFLAGAHAEHGLQIAAQPAHVGRFVHDVCAFGQLAVFFDFLGAQAGDGDDGDIVELRVEVPLCVGMAAMAASSRVTGDWTEEWTLGSLYTLVFTWVTL